MTKRSISKKPAQLKRPSRTQSAPNPIFTFVPSNYAGGRGTSPEDAVRILLTTTEDGVAAEYAYLEQEFGSQMFWEVLKQALVNMAGKDYDVIDVRLVEGEVRQVYFDVSAFFGRK